MTNTQGVLREAVDKLCRLIASSSNFQDEVKKYTQEAADTRIHRVAANEPDELPRPFAVIEIGERNKTKIAEGMWDGEGFLTLTLATEMAHPDQEGESLIDFADWAYAVLEDICELAGCDDHLNVREARQEQEPVYSNPTTGATVPYCWASWQIRWARF